MTWMPSWRSWGTSLGSDQADLLARTNALEPELIMPPLAEAPDVCATCCDWAADPPTCEKCRDAIDVLGTPLARVIPITLYEKPSPMRDRLTFYKSPRGAEDALYATEVASMFERFFQEHGSELARRHGPFDASVVVPSKAESGENHPLEIALGRLPALSVPKREHLLKRGAGEIGRRRTSRDGFLASSSADGMRVLLLDDVYTTGATAQSAAHALTIAGAIVPAVVVAGRRLNPSVVGAVSTIMERQRRLGFSFARDPWIGL